MASVVLCTTMAACGGGGGGGGASGGGGGGSGGGGSGGGGGGDVIDPNLLAVVKVSVSDGFGAAIEGATVQGASRTVLTDAKGAALVLLDAPELATRLTVSRETYVDQSVVALATLGQVNEFKVVLQRETVPAAASLGSRSGTAPDVDATRRQLSFEIELVVVDGGSAPVTDLSLSSFALKACTPDAANGRADCLRGASADDDRAYVPLTAAPESLMQVAGGAVRPYAAAMLLDQSGSIQTSDPTGARLYSAKAFLGGLGAEDRAQLAAFAGDPGAKLPTLPLTTYGPFRDAASVSSLFPELDSLASLVGGNTPLYASLDSLRQSVADDTSLPPGLTRAVVLFTDGSDTDCAGVDSCRARRAQSIQGAIDSQVRLFTIGLSSGVDVAALGELAVQTGGAFLYADSAQQLLPLYGSLGKLLSLSLPAYRLRWTVQAESAQTFRSGHTLLGKVQVSVAGRSFDVPFLVGIP